MGQLLAIHTNDLWEPRVTSRSAIVDALAAQLITTALPQRSIPMPVFNPDDDNAPGSPPPTEPAPDELRCGNCGEAHHIQRCPEILDALFAPLTGAEIARAWHRNYRGFARHIEQKPANERIRAAYLYTRYMTERLPKQRYQLRLTDTLAAWEKAAA